MAAKDLYEKDLYRILGVKKSDDADVIKKQYRKLARELHPDKNKGDKKLEERFKEVSESYEILSDDKKRAEYDEMRSLFNSGRMPRGGVPNGGRGGSPFNGGGQRFSQGNFSDIFGGGGQNMGPSDIFSSLFGGGQRKPQKGSDAYVDAHISFRDSIQGKELPINVVIDGEKLETKIKIPAGITDKSKLRLANRGGRGPDGNGDLYVTIHINTHPVYTRKDFDLIIKVPVTYSEAVLGGHIKVPKFDRELVTLNLPAGTQPGTKLRVKGAGVKTSKHHGDLIVKIELVVPKVIDEKSAELLKAYTSKVETVDVRKSVLENAKL